MKRKFVMSPNRATLCVVLAACYLIGASGAAGSPAPGSVISAVVSDRQRALNELVQDIREAYPEIAHIDVEEALQRHGKATFVDVRETKEFAVSRIPGAVHIGDAEALLAYARAHSGPLVLYCSVGQRSADFTRLLHEAGHSQAVNFGGSIFAWGNHRLPLENDSGAVEAVHPFDWFWGWRYLDADLHATEPPTPLPDGGLLPQEDSE